MLKYTLLMTLLVGVVTAATFKVADFKPMPAKGFAVVELFTSQGCSSCPPADKLLQKLQRETKEEPVYLLTYHVDYWDHLGWKDPFSQAKFSARQRQYSRWFGQGNVYTPQMVVNGAQEFVGSNEKVLRTALAKALTVNVPTQLLLKWGPGGKSQLQLEYAATGELNDSKLMLAVVQPQAQTTILRGENKGRTLAHINIVRDMVAVPISTTKKAGFALVSLPPELKNQDWELVGFLQQTATGKILAAAKLAAIPIP